MAPRGARELFARSKALDRSALGMLVASSDPAFTEAIAHSGFDFVIIDGEHSPMGPSEMLGHVRAADATGAVPIARVWEYSRGLMQKMLDIGAQGVVIPHSEDPGMVKDAIAASRFPDRGGVRSFCPATHAAGYAMSRWDAHAQHSTENFLVIPLIESVKGLEAFDEIIAVDGVDMVYFGSGDLAIDMGVWLDDPKIAEIWRGVRDRAHAAGVAVMASEGVPGIGAGEADAIVMGMDLLKFSAMASSLAQNGRQRFGGAGDTQDASS